jgi:hypothetical protein
MLLFSFFYLTLFSSLHFFNLHFYDASTITSRQKVKANNENWLNFPFFLVLERGRKKKKEEEEMTKRFYTYTTQSLRNRREKVKMKSQ